MSANYRGLRGCKRIQVTLFTASHSAAKIDIKARLKIVRRATTQSVTKALADWRHKNLKVRHAGLVVGSQIDPTVIGNRTFVRMRWKDNCFALNSSKLCTRTELARLFSPNATHMPKRGLN
jgi:hypothetical protein